jgi:hypothetical protein
LQQVAIEHKKYLLSKLANIPNGFVSSGWDPGGG